MLLGDFKIGRQIASLNCKPSFRIYVFLRGQMNSLRFIGYLFFTLQIASLAVAQPDLQDCTTDCLRTQAIPTMESGVLSAPMDSKQDADCPQAGFVLINDVASERGLVLALQGIFNELSTQVAPQQELLRKDQSHCGVCHQHNVVSMFSTSEPEKIRTDVVCDTHFAKNIEKTIDDSKIRSYMQDTLTSKNPEGKKIGEACSDKCSYSIAVARTQVAATSSRLDLTILCGQPRDGFVLFSTYNFTVGFIQRWTCSK